MKKYRLFVISLLVLVVPCTRASGSKVDFISYPDSSKIDILVNGIYFTSLIYSPDIEKPCLYPIKTPSGKFITRGYPLKPRPYERTDHVHHYGLWFNFGDVNGIDFWNNSPDKKAEEKHRYGSIKIVEPVVPDPHKGTLTTSSVWVDHDNNVLLSEKTVYVFGGRENDVRTIERITELTAVQEVVFHESKEGLLGLRVDRSFEAPVDKPIKRLDSAGNFSESLILNNDGINGVYRNAEGLTGEKDVWGKKSPWVALTAEKEGETITIVLLDHHRNPNYPAWFHAREYGLFSINNLAGREMDKSSEPVKLRLGAGEKIVFKHQVVIGGNLTNDQINTMRNNFNKQ